LFGEKSTRLLLSVENSFGRPRAGGAGGTKFDFTFRPRFGLRAQTAASVVYDYYNPDARAIVAPTRFVVK